MSEDNPQPNNPGGQGGVPDNNGAPANPQPAALPSQRVQAPAIPDEFKDDPEVQKAISDPVNLYKRYQGSSKEAREKAEALAKAQGTLTEREQYISQVSAELNQVFEADPELKKKFQDVYQRMQKGELPPKPNNPEANGGQSIPELDELKSEVGQIRAERRARMKANIDNFRDTYKDVIQGDSDWKRITGYAEGLYGRPGHDGQPMNEVASLQAAIEIAHPEIRDDKVRLRTLAERMNRDSAASPGNYAPGGSPRGSSVQLTPAEQRAAAGFGMTPEEYVKQRDRK